MALELKVDGVDAGYGAVHALAGVSIQVAAGETVALLGANGNGKSTLTNASWAWCGRPGAPSRSRSMGNPRPHQAAGRGHRRVGRRSGSRGPPAIPKLTVEENLLLGAFRKKARATMARNLDFAFETFPILKERRRQLAGTMSGGQQQMLAIARALMSAPRLLLVDEPSVGLSPLLVTQTITKIGELKRQFGLTVLMAEQNFHGHPHRRRGYIIVHGEIALDARSVAELEANDLVKRLYLGGTA